MTEPNNEQLCAELHHGNHSALDMLVERNLSFIQRTANELVSQYQRPSFLDDLIQEGALGLIRAAWQFDSERGTLFLTYAGWWVKKYMQDYLAEQIATETVSLDDISQAEAVSTSDFWGNGYVQLPENILIHKETMTELYDALNAVSKRDRAYLWYRYGFPDSSENRTRKDTADHFHLSERRAKHTEENALKNLRQKVFSGE